MLLHQFRFLQVMRPGRETHTQRGQRGPEGEGERSTEGEREEKREWHSEHISAKRRFSVSLSTPPRPGFPYMIRKPPLTWSLETLRDSRVGEGERWAGEVTCSSPPTKPHFYSALWGI